MLYRVGMWTPQDAPAGSGDSFVIVQGNTRWPSEGFHARGKLEVAFFHSDQLESVGVTGDMSETRYFCGTEGLYLGDRVHVAHNVSLVPGPMQMGALVRKTGVHYLVLSYCQHPEVTSEESDP